MTYSIRVDRTDQNAHRVQVVRYAKRRPVVFLFSSLRRFPSFKQSAEEKIVAVAMKEFGFDFSSPRNFKVFTTHLQLKPKASIGGGFL